mgnify:CR=1 FL=1
MKAPQTRQTLLEKLRDKYDESSWDEFQQIYEPYVRRILRAMKMNDHDCNDLLQNVMLICWKSLPKFEYKPEKGSFRAWISTVSRRETVHFIKKRQRTFISVKEEDSQYLQMALDEVSRPQIDKEILVEWQKFISEKAWDNIKERFSDKVLAMFEDLTKGVNTEDLAAKYEVSESAVYVYKKRVLNSLQKEIIKLDRELGS